MTRTPDILLPQKFEHPEGVKWDATKQRLLWVDIFKGHVCCYDLASQKMKTIEAGRVIGSVAPRHREGFICAVEEGFGFLSEEGKFDPFGGPLHDTSRIQMNDGAVDARGRFWAGSMTFQFATHPGICSLYRVDGDRHITRQMDGVSISNGIGWSPDSRYCYYVDSASHSLDRFDFDLDSGTFSNRTKLAHVDEFPDGLAVDADGCIWVAIFGGWEVRRITPSGKVDRVIRLPGSQVTTCAFGGRDLRTLFVAVSPHGMDEESLKGQTAGYIFAMDVGVQGLPTAAFAG